MFCLPVLVLATIEIPAKAAVTFVSGSFEQTTPSTSGMNGTPPGLVPTGIGLATLLALRRQKKNSL
jgi:hypothetical protein